MLSFVCGNYLLAIEFFDKDNKIIKTHNKDKKDDSSDKGESVEIDRDIFSFTKMDILFELNKIPSVIIHSVCKDIDFIKKVAFFTLSVNTINFKIGDNAVPPEEQLGVFFPATPININVNNSWHTEWRCLMDYYQSLTKVNEISFIKSNYLDKKYVYKTKSIKTSDGKEKEIKYLDLEHLNNFNSYTAKESNIQLKDALEDLTKTTFHKPSEYLLENGMSTVASSFSNKTKAQVLEELIMSSGSSDNSTLPEGTYFTFGKIRSLKEVFNNSNSSIKEDILKKIKLIEPKGRIESNTTSTSKENDGHKINELEVKDLIKIVKDKNGKTLFSDPVLDSDSSALKNRLNKDISLKNCIKFTYISETPGFLSIGDPVFIFTSFDSCKMYFGFVTKELLHFDHKIWGDYEISVNPNYIEQKVEVEKSKGTLTKKEPQIEKTDSGATITIK